MIIIILYQQSSLYTFMIIAIITIHLSTILDTVLETKVLAINVKANVSNPFGPVGIIIISAWMCRGKAHLHLAVQLSVGNLSDYTITARSILIEALRLRPVGPVWTGHVLQASARLFFCPSLFFFWHLSAFPANWCGIYLHNLIRLKFDSYFHSK